MLDLVSVGFGIMLGVIVTLVLYVIRTDGYFRVDCSDKDKNVYLLDLSIDLDDVPKKRKIILNVDTKYHPQ